MKKKGGWLRQAGDILVTGISVFGLEFLPGVLKFLPLKIVYFFGGFLSYAYYCFARRNRILAEENLKIALGKTHSARQLAAVLRGSFLTMGHIVLDTLYYKGLTEDRLRKLVRIEGLENLKSALAKSHGVIVVSAHLGSFTILAKRLTIEGYKAHFIARHARKKRVEQIILKFCREAGQKIIFNKPSLTCMRCSFQVLSRNEVLVIELDQNFGTEGVEVNFFKRKAMVATGPVKLSRNTKAAIVPMFIIRQPDNTHVLKIEPEVTLVPGESDEVLKENLQNIINIIEKYILRYPDQWVNWIHKPWKVEK